MDRASKPLFRGKPPLLLGHEQLDIHSSGLGFKKMSWLGTLNVRKFHCSLKFSLRFSLFCISR